MDLSSIQLPDVIMEPLSDVRCLVWPRIPKTGGENLLNLLKNLIPSHKLIVTDAGSAYNEDKETYSFAPHEKYDLEKVTYYELIEYFDYVINHRWTLRKGILSKKPNANLFILQYHAPFMSINLSEALLLKVSEWKYISMIRHPIDRIVSSFYYLRGESGGWRGQNESEYNQLYVPKILELQKNFTIDQCIDDYINGKNICEFSTNYYVKWFCGGDLKLCNPMNINEDSYKLAIENIDKHFAWIGVMEYYKETVYSLYDRFPLFFEHYMDRIDFAKRFEFLDYKMKEIRENYGYGHYQKPNAQSVEIMKKKNDFDLKLYNYVLKKFG